MMMMGRPQGRGPGGRPQAGQRGGPFMGLSAPVERSKDFRGTLRKLLARLRPERLVIAVVVVLGSLSVVFSVIGPKITGNAMNIIFDGVIGKSLPAGVPKETAVELLRAQGKGQLADMLAATNAVPGQGIDFGALAGTLALTVLGVLAMMLWISPLLALISVITIPLSFAVTIVIAGRSQKEFIAQWAETGALNGHVEQMHSGHTLVQVFGRRRSAIQQFNGQNERLYRASFRAQFLSGIIQPAMQFLSNLNYVGVAVIGGYRVASGAMSLGDVTAFIAYSRQFTMPLLQIAAQMNLLQSGLASAERVFEFLGASEETPDRVSAAAPRAVTGHVEFDRVAFRYLPEKPLIEDFS